MQIQDDKIYQLLLEMLATMKATQCFKKIMTVDDLVLYTSMSKSHIYKLCSKMEIPHYKKGKRLLYFEKTQIDNWLLSNPVPVYDHLLEKALVTIKRPPRKLMIDELLNSTEVLNEMKSVKKTNPLKPVNTLNSKTPKRRKK